MDAELFVLVVLHLAGFVHPHDSLLIVFSRLNLDKVSRVPFINLWLESALSFILLVVDLGLGPSLPRSQPLR